MRLFPSSLVPVTLALLCFTPLSAQMQMSQSAGTVIQANARAVVVDVVVTKGNGDPVSGLHKEAFQVLEDGKPQVVDFFEEHTSKTLPAGAVTPLPKMPEHVYTNVPQAPESDSVNVLLLDTLNTPKQDQSYVHLQITEFLKKMEPGTRAAIFTLGSKLCFVQGFTSDSSALLAALNDKKSGVTPDKNVASHSRDDAADDQEQIAIKMMMLGGRSDGGVEALQQSQGEYTNFQYGERTMMTLEALNYLARYLGGVPGRKNLIWFASQFPVTIFPSSSQRQSMSEARVYASAVKNTADLLTVSKVAVYPVSAEGMMVDHGMEANSAGPSGMGGIRAYSEEASGRADTIFAMEELAADTGGKAYYNTNDLNMAMKRAIDDGSHYYTLVYSPTNKKIDGSYRRIELKVTEGKYKLAYRRGYNADSSATSEARAESDPLRPLLMRGLPSATQVLYGVRVVPVEPQPASNATHAGKNPKLTGPLTRYSIDFMIRRSDVKLDAGPNGSHRGKIQLGLMAYDRNGKAVN